LWCGSNEAIRQADAVASDVTEAAIDRGIIVVTSCMGEAQSAANYIWSAQEFPTVESQAESLTGGPYSVLKVF
jgi:hypothetical protein